MFVGIGKDIGALNGLGIVAEDIIDKYYGLCCIRWASNVWEGVALARAERWVWKEHGDEVRKDL